MIFHARPVLSAEARSRQRMFVVFFENRGLDLNLEGGTSSLSHRWAFHFR